MPARLVGHAHPSSNESYAAGELPWDTREPEPLLVRFGTALRTAPTRTLANAQKVQHAGNKMMHDIANPRHTAQEVLACPS